MKQLVVFTLGVLVSTCHAAEHQPKTEVGVSVHKVGESFEVKASYLVPMDMCNAFAFITDYEDARNIKGIAESKIISRTDNKVIVERKAKETVLLFPLEINTTIEYAEILNRGLNFEQIHGDNRLPDHAGSEISGVYKVLQRSCGGDYGVLVYRGKHAE